MGREEAVDFIKKSVFQFWKCVQPFIRYWASSFQGNCWRVQWDLSQKSFQLHLATVFLRAFLNFQSIFPQEECLFLIWTALSQIQRVLKRRDPNIQWHPAPCKVKKCGVGVSWHSQRTAGILVLAAKAQTWTAFISLQGHYPWMEPSEKSSKFPHEIPVAPHERPSDSPGEKSEDWVKEASHKMWLS